MQKRPLLQPLRNLCCHLVLTCAFVCPAPLGFTACESSPGGTDPGAATDANSDDGEVADGVDIAAVDVETDATDAFDADTSETEASDADVSEADASDAESDSEADARDAENDSHSEADASDMGTSAGDTDVEDAVSDGGELVDPYWQVELGEVRFVGGSGEKLDVAIEPDGDLHVVYNRDRTVYYRYQTDGVWDTNEQSIPGSSTSYHTRWAPRIAVASNGDTHFAWASFLMTDVYYTTFTGEWRPLETAISDSEGGSDTSRYDIAVDSSDSAIVVAQSDSAIEANIRPAGGEFAGEHTIFYDNPTEPQFPAIVASRTDSTMHCVYADNTATEGLQYNRFNGSVWSDPERPGGDGGGCCVNHVGLGLDSFGLLHVIWISWTVDRNFGDLSYVRQTSDGGWTDIHSFVSEPDYFTCVWDECPLPRVAISESGAVLVVFASGDARSSTVSYFLKLPGESGWPTEPERITTAGGFQHHPALAVDGDTFIVLWTEGILGRIAMRTLSVELVTSE